MRPGRNIENIIRKFKIDVDPKKDQEIFDEVQQVHTESKQLKPGFSQIDLWRIIMNNKTKFATAASVVLIAIFGITVFDWFVTPAWAIEQTIEALKNISSVKISGYAYYPDNPKVSFEVWAKPHSKDPSISGDFRLHEGDHHICVASEEKNLTYVYTEEPGRDAVYITEGLNRGCRPFPTSELFKQFKEIATNWKEEYRKDPKTGRDCVFVTCEGPSVNTARYWKLQFDLETKFPVCASVWWDKDYKGQPHYEYKDIIYNPEMPDDTFTFKVARNMQVIDCRNVRKILDENPDCGIEVDDLAAGQVCKKVVEEYWRAVIKWDPDRIQNLRPLAVGTNWDKLAKAYQTNIPAMLVSIKGINHLNDPGTFAEVTCIVETRDGKTAESVLNIDLRQTEKGRIAVIAGVKGSELTILN